MAGETWWEELLRVHLNDLSDENKTPIRFDDALKNSFRSSCDLGRDAWDQIAACITVNEKVNCLDRKIHFGGERAFKGLVYALWKSGQGQAASKLDERGAWRPKTVVWFCCNEYQAHSILQCLLKFKKAASNLVAKTIYPDGKKNVYCQVQVAFTDFYEEVVRHSFYIVYPEDDAVPTLQKCVRHVQQNLQPSLVVHVGTACSSGEGDQQCVCLHNACAWHLYVLYMLHLCLMHGHCNHEDHRSSRAKLQLLD